MLTRTHNQKEKSELRRELRNHGTSAEATMWLMLKARQVEGIKFRRQFSIGPYILDFYSPELRLCIELDGQPHHTTEGYLHDQKRTEYLKQIHKIKILRFENEKVFHYPKGILSEIRNEIERIRKEKTSNF